MFGCRAYPHVQDGERHKFDSKAKKLRFVGYSLQSKGYQLYEEKQKVVVRYHISFHEKDFSHECD